VPELPEVETVRRGLQAALAGDKIILVEVLRDQSVAYPSASEFAALLPGHRFGDVLRRGKYLLLELDSGAGLACHLRMSGRLLIRGEKPGKLRRKKTLADAEPRFLRVRMLLASGRELHFEDMRVFGRLWFKPPQSSFEEVIPALAALGAEPLGDEPVDGAYLEAALAGKSRAIKTVLLDQQVLAGVGNIYADEALFLSGIHPLSVAGKIQRRKLDVLAATIVQVLSRAIESGGSTLRDYASAAGVNGNYQNEAWVYGREKEPCRVCKSIVVRLKINGRSSHFCPKCQPLKTRKFLSR
jgi:formamidopyrimidine-DNA glycosylase